ncbi:glycosyltransferase [candidate division KSB1 bacterium]|nr:glycosyltransferase [candidate division KSB1 bacterium]
MSILLGVFYLSVLIYGLGLLFFNCGLFFPQKPQSKLQPMVSVIIAARNEEKNIAACLTPLTQQTYPRHLFEVIVVSDNSIDRTDEIISEFSRQFPQIQLMRVDGIPNGLTPKKNAINYGIHHSRGEIILTTDADCRVKTTWIETMVGHFTKNTGMVIGFSQLGQKGQTQTLLEQLQALDFLALMASAEGATNLGWPLAASGQNLAYRRQAFDEVGGFVRIGHRVSGDDVLLLQLIARRTKWKIVFAHEAAAHNFTQAEKSLRTLFNQRTRWASNGPYQIFLNLPFFLYILAVFLVNLGVFAAGIGWATGWLSWRILALPFGIKLVSELNLALRATRLFGRNDLLKIFPLWFVVQMPYVVLVGMLGSVGNFSWKGRQHGFASQYLKWGEPKK